ncbi:MAG: ribosome biogenesis GTPase, partial [Bacteroidia bacterium]
DRVTVEEDPKDSSQGVITHISERKNYIVRRSVNLSKRSHIIAANIDQLIVLATVSEPRTSLGFIDRLLVTAEAYTIPAIIVFNKADLLSEEENEVLSEYRYTYESIGYQTLLVSALDKTGLDDLKALMKDKTSLVSGHSGVGKSTLINVIEPDLDLKVNAISEVHRKGTHTTTFAEMFPLAFGGFIIDSPGIKEFGMIDMDNDHIGHYFPEIFKTSDECKFNNCSHMNEPHCAVKNAVECGDIAESRYNTYLSIVSELE